MVCIIYNVVDEETVFNYNYYVKTKNFAITFVNRWRNNYSVRILMVCFVRSKSQ